MHLEEQDQRMIGLPKDLNGQKEYVVILVIVQLPCLSPSLDIQRFCLPSRPSEIQVLDRIQLAPSQLHPNFQTYMMVFQITCHNLKLIRSIPFFFNIFKLLQHKENSRLKQGYMSFKQKKCFMAFTDSQKGFKRRYYYVVVRSKEATL